jgi:hypothetical protein
LAYTIAAWGSNSISLLLGTVTTCLEGFICFTKLSKLDTRFAHRLNLLAVILLERNSCQRLLALCVTVFSSVSIATAWVTDRALV